MERVVDDALAFVKDVFCEDCSGHDYFHTLRVYRMAVKLAQQEQADLDIVRLAALLHDVDDAKLSPETCADQGRAAGFLRAHGVPEDRIKAICGIIGEVSFKGSDSVTPETAEGKCVQDADRLDALGAIGIARAFAYGGSRGRAMHDPEVKPVEHMDGAQYRNHCATTVNHFYEKLFLLKELMNTDTAKKIAEQREEYMRRYLAEFMREWDGMC